MFPKSIDNSLKCSMAINNAKLLASICSLHVYIISRNIKTQITFENFDKS